VISLVNAWPLVQSNFVTRRVISLVKETEIRFFSVEFVFQMQLIFEPLILDTIFHQKLHFDFYLNRLIGEYIR